MARNYSCGVILCHNYPGSHPYYVNIMKVFSNILFLSSWRNKQVIINKIILHVLIDDVTFVQLFLHYIIALYLSLIQVREHVLINNSSLNIH